MSPHVCLLWTGLNPATGACVQSSQPHGGTRKRDTIVEIMLRTGYSSDRVWRYPALVLIAFAFLLSVWLGLSAGFDGDDLMNLHEAVEATTLQQLVVGLVFPFTSLNRPTGELYYRICYWLFGWHPLGFRLTMDTFMAANVALVYSLARGLAGSAEAGLLAALLFAFHGRLWMIYMSTGTVYDVLCAFFSLLALRYYIDTRTGHVAMDRRRLAMLAVLFILALNAKEMAAVLPALFLIYDWICAAPDRPFAKRARWILTNSWPAAALGTATIASFWGKTQIGGPFVNPAYKMSFTVASYFFTARFYFSELFYQRPHTLVGRHIIFLFVLLFVIAAAMKCKQLWFLVWCAVLAPLPVLFIPPRYFFAMYLPWACWSMFAATTLVLGRDRLFSDSLGFALADSRFASVYERYARVLPLGFCVLAIVCGLRDPEFRARASAVDPISRIIELSKEDFMFLNEPLPHGASILLLGSRFPAEANRYFPLMIMRLLYRDRNLRMDRAEFMTPQPGPTQFAQYDRVIGFDGIALNVLMRSVAAGSATHLSSTVPGWWR